MSNPKEGATPKLHVEWGSAENTEHTATGERGRGADAHREDFAEAVGFVRGLGAAAWKFAQRHPYTVAYGVVGLVLAVLILTIGLWATVVIAVFVLVGALIGQIRDGDNSLVNFLGNLVRSWRS